MKPEQELVAATAVGRLPLETWQVGRALRNRAGISVRAFGTTAYSIGTVHSAGLKMSTGPNTGTRSTVNQRWRVLHASDYLPSWLRLFDEAVTRPRLAKLSSKTIGSG